LLVIAGLIEGFVSPTAIDPAVKFVIGGSLLALLTLYLLTVRAEPPMLNEQRGHKAPAYDR